VEKGIGGLGSQQPMELKDKRRRRREMKPPYYILFYKVKSAAIHDTDFLAVS
jgi:hypothetical protein